MLPAGRVAYKEWLSWRDLILHGLRIDACEADLFAPFFRRRPRLGTPDQFAKVRIGG
jgi:hypothetical protein